MRLPQGRGAASGRARQMTLDRGHSPVSKHWNSSVAHRRFICEAVLNTEQLKQLTNIFLGRQTTSSREGGGISSPSVALQALNFRSPLTDAHLRRVRFHGSVKHRACPTGKVGLAFRFVMTVGEEQATWYGAGICYRMVRSEMGRRLGRGFAPRNSGQHRSAPAYRRSFSPKHQGSSRGATRGSTAGKARQFCRTLRAQADCGGLSFVPVHH